MATLMIGGMPEDVKDAVRRAAAIQDRGSMSAYAIRILAERAQADLIDDAEQRRHDAKPKHSIKRAIDTITRRS